MFSGVEYYCLAYCSVADSGLTHVICTGRTGALGRKSTNDCIRFCTVLREWSWETDIWEVSYVCLPQWTTPRGSDVASMWRILVDVTSLIKTSTRSWPSESTFERQSCPVHRTQEVYESSVYRMIISCVKQTAASLTRLHDTVWLTKRHKVWVIRFWLTVTCAKHENKNKNNGLCKHAAGDLFLVVMQIGIR